MAMLDIFNNDAFSQTSLTDVINGIPYVPSRVRELGLFTPRPVRTTTIAIERKDATLSLLPFSPRGSAPTQNKKDLANIRTFQIPHVALSDVIQADEIQNVRASGSETELQGIAAEIEERMTRMTRSFDATLEFHMLSAMRGILLNSDGTPYLNYFTEFEVTPPAAVVFDLDLPTPQLRKAIAGVQRSIEDSLGGESVGQIHALCGPAFMDDLVDNDEVQDAYDRWQNGQQKRSRYARRQFEFAEVIFEEYRGEVPDENGNLQKFVGDDEVIFFPADTPYFEIYFGPADYMSTVNTKGEPRYARQDLLPKDRGVEIEVQTNPLAMCRRPEIIRIGQRT